VRSLPLSRAVRHVGQAVAVDVDGVFAAGL
jgi:hypothetical protein